jgi:hypothetical protein
VNRLTRNALIGTAATAALVAGACVPAFAAGPTPSPTHTPRTLASIQAAAKTQTSKREASLHTAIGKITAAKGISSADRATVLATLNSDLSAMSAVEAKIAADTTVKSAAADSKTIDTTYRVYAVAIPQAHLASAADRLTSTAIPTLTAAHTKLAAALSGRDASKSTPALQADLTDMAAQITAADNALNGVSAKALAVTPSDFNANKSVLSPLRSSVKTAVADLKKARSDAKTIRAAIK